MGNTNTHSLATALQKDFTADRWLKNPEAYRWCFERGEYVEELSRMVIIENSEKGSYNMCKYCLENLTQHPEYEQYICRHFPLIYQHYTYKLVHMIWKSENFNLIQMMHQHINKRHNGFYSIWEFYLDNKMPYLREINTALQIKVLEDLPERIGLDCLTLSDEFDQKVNQIIFRRFTRNQSIVLSDIIRKCNIKLFVDLLPIHAIWETSASDSCISFKEFLNVVNNECTMAYRKYLRLKNHSRMKRPAKIYSHSSDNCVCCLNAPIIESTIVMSCGHQDVCDDCIWRLDFCPLCRKPFEWLEET